MGPKKVVEAPPVVEAPVVSTANDLAELGVSDAAVSAETTMLMS